MTNRVHTPAMAKTDIMIQVGGWLWSWCFYWWFSGLWVGVGIGCLCMEGIVGVLGLARSFWG